MNSNSNTQTFRHVLRATIELTTPCLIASGMQDDIADSVFVSDANGVPALPGTSIAGVFRASFREEFNDPESEKRIFGSQAGNEGRASCLRVSWACIHDSLNHPVEGIVPPERLSDPVLASAKSPIIRDHVRIGEHGAAEEGGKFDEQAVAAGHRFTFELEFFSDGGAVAQADWSRITDLLSSPSLRIGGKTRRGYGAFKIVRLLEGTFDFRKKEDFQAFTEHPVSLAAPTNALSKTSIPSAAAGGGSVTYTLRISPSGYWMIGGGDDIADDGGNADMVPYRDQRIVWQDDSASVTENCIVIPGSSIKGALAHRIAFHYNAIQGQFADSPDAPPAAAETNLAVRKLFGYVDGQQAERGKVLIDDVYLPTDPAPPSPMLHHVGIDRFTGGARDSVLFNERPLWQGKEIPPLLITLTDPSVLDEDAIREAFERTIYDLVENRLQLGAGHGRGLGYFKGTIEKPELFNSNINQA